MCALLDENLPHETTMTFPLYTLRSAPIHRGFKIGARARDWTHRYSIDISLLIL